MTVTANFLRARVRSVGRERVRQVLEQVDRTASEEQKRIAARELGCEDVLPEPQEELPLADAR